MLGSATPSLETIYNVQKKKYRRLVLPARESGEKTKIELVDLSKIKVKDLPERNISPVLFEALKNTLAKGEQAFILYNRRGFAAFLQCPKCGYAPHCPNCSVSLSFHQKLGQLLCHYCGYTHQLVAKCPDCKKNGDALSTPPDLIKRGAGTEKIYEEVQRLLPTARLARFDRDSIRKLSDLETVLKSFRDGEIDILVGTQMIAKGHDFPNVTLVGVTDADTGLIFPDFRAAEKTFQLISQVAGRAGRADKPGQVYIQTHLPAHHSIFNAAAKNYLNFAEAELRIRRALNYPPFSRLLRITTEGYYPDKAFLILKEIKRQSEIVITEHNLAITLLGPVEAPLAKIKNRFRFQLLAKSAQSTQLTTLIRNLKSQKWRDRTTRILYDLDPVDMM